MLLGIDGRGDDIARCVFTKFTEIFCKISVSGGKGARCAKYFCAKRSSDGRCIQCRTNASNATIIVLYHRSTNDILSVYGNIYGKEINLFTMWRRLIQQCSLLKFLSHFFFISRLFVRRDFSNTQIKHCDFVVYSCTSEVAHNAKAANALQAKMKMENSTEIKFIIWINFM